MAQEAAYASSETVTGSRRGCPITRFQLHTQAEARLLAASTAMKALHKAPPATVMSQLCLPTFASFLVSGVRSPAAEAEALILESAAPQSP